MNDSMTSNEGRDDEACCAATRSSLIGFARDYWLLLVAGAVVAVIQRLCAA